MDWFTRNRAIRDAHGYPVAQKVVLFALNTYINGEGDGAWPSIGTLAASCGQSERTTQRALRDLEAAGAIVREAPGTHHRTAVYRIAHPLPTPPVATAGEDPRHSDTLPRHHDTPATVPRGDTMTPQGVTMTPYPVTMTPQGVTMTPERPNEETHEVNQESPIGDGAPAAPREVDVQVSLPLVASPVEEPPAKGKRRTGAAPPTLTADEAAAWEAAEGVRAAQAVRLRARPYPPPWELSCIRRRLSAGWTVDDFAIVARWFWSPEEAGRRATSDPASTYWRECHDGAYLEAAHRALTQPRIPPVQAARIAWGMYREAVGWAHSDFPGALGEAIEARLGYEVAEAVYDAHKVLAWKLRRAPGEAERREVAAEWGADVTARVENAWSSVDRARAAR